MKKTHMNWKLVKQNYYEVGISCTASTSIIDEHNNKYRWKRNSINPQGCYTVKISASGIDKRSCLPK